MARGTCYIFIGGIFFMANELSRGRGGKNNFPTSKPEAKDDQTRKLYMAIQKNCLEFYNAGKVKVKSDEELIKRLDYFFMHCAETGQIPTVEKMCLCLGYVRNTIFDWETGKQHGFSPETKDIIKNAKQLIASFDSELLLSGKLNPVAYIFRAKNYYGMKDQQEHVVAAVDPLGETVSEDEIKKRIEADTKNIIDV